MSTYAMPTVLGHTFTLSEWAELNRLRMARMHAERRTRAAQLRQGRYAALGTDHPALLVREIAHRMTVARCETSRNSLSMVEWAKARGLRVQTDTAIHHAEQDLAEAKAWCTLYYALMVAARRVLSRVGKQLEHLAARVAFAMQKVRPENEHRPTLHPVALACHLAPQAPPSMATHRTHCGGARPSTTHLQKGGENN
jgi:hypothetical protein